jgi:two-component system, NtrC family, response regulator AlgB
MRVLVIDDEENIRKTTAVALENMGHDVVAVEDGASARKQLDRSVFDAALLDLKLRVEDGLELLPELLRNSPQLSIVVFTAYASIESAVEAMRRGAVDYIPKPFTPDQIRQVLEKVQQTRRLQGRVEELESRLSSDSPSLDLTTEEPAVQKVYQTLDKAAPTSATVLLTGESGTGKSVVARALHERSLQRTNNFVTISCPSLSRELLESELFGHIKGAFTGAAGDTWGKVARAEGGTLFLDEIGELPMEIQPKLLRLLQEKEYERVGETKIRRANVRVIAATNRDLARTVQEGRFREDLFYRMNVITVNLPPLRDRPRDLARIARGYLSFFGAQCGKRMKGFCDEAEHAMKRYEWPGNLRELRNVVERAVILGNGDRVSASDLPDGVRESSGLAAEAGVRLGTEVTLEMLQREHIRRVLGWARSMEHAARVLGIDPATLYRKRKRLGL